MKRIDSALIIPCETPGDKRFQNLTGKHFGRLHVVSLFGHFKSNNNKSIFFWTCRCNCGQTVNVRGHSLKSGVTKSCGCLKREVTSRVGQSQAVHGMTHTPEFHAWTAMKSRCSNPNDPGWVNYGGRGISVDSVWINSFESFYKHIGPRPSPCHSVDRYPDNNGNYKPGNVRWATMKQQKRNTRANYLITHNGETLCSQEWSERIGIPADTLRYRIKIGWSMEKVLTEPLLRMVQYKPRKSKLAQTH